MTTTVTSSYKTILDAIEFDELTPLEQESFLLDLNSLIFRGAVLRTVERMDDKTKDAWQELLSGEPTETDMRTFLERRVSGAELALVETVETLANDILAVSNNR